MACENEIHENDIGTEFIFTIVECINDVDTHVDISTSTSRKIFFVDIDDGRDEYDAVYTSVASGGAGDGSDGKISYFTVLGDLSPIGGFKMQGVVTTPSGKWHSKIDSFEVKENL